LGVAELTWTQVLAWRMARHYLAAPAPKESWLDVVSRIGGLQAQVLSSAELSVWARVDSLDKEALIRALWHDRSAVKLWALRGTLHIFPSAEFGLWQQAGQCQHDRRPSWYRNFGLSETELDTMVDAVGQALEHRLLTREELAVEVARITGIDRFAEEFRQSWGLYLRPPSFRGCLCFAPNAGRNVRFTNPKTWLPHYAAVDSHSATLEITRRYLGACGPATATDLAHWWGVPVRTAAAAIRDLGAEIVAVSIEGKSAWMLAAHLPDTARATPTRAVRLLPAFDPYVISASPHVSHLLPGDFRQRIYRPQGWLSPVLVIDGRMQGVWSWERRGARVAVEIKPFVKLPKWARQRAEREAHRLAGFMGGRLQLVWQAA
jgi:hypothetical protein